MVYILVIVYIMVMFMVIVYIMVHRSYGSRFFSDIFFVLTLLAPWKCFRSWVLITSQLY